MTEAVADAKTEEIIEAKVAEIRADKESMARFRKNLYLHFKAQHQEALAESVPGQVMASYRGENTYEGQPIAHQLQGVARMLKATVESLAAGLANQQYKASVPVMLRERAVELLGEEAAGKRDDAAELERQAKEADLRTERIQERQDERNKEKAEERNPQKDEDDKKDSPEGPEMAGLVFKRYASPEKVGWAGWYDDADGIVRAFLNLKGQVIPFEGANKKAVDHATKQKAAEAKQDAKDQKTADKQAKKDAKAAGKDPENPEENEKPGVVPDADEDETEVSSDDMEG